MPKSQITDQPMVHCIITITKQLFYMLKPIFWVRTCQKQMTIFSRTPDWDFRRFYPCEIILSQIPRHTRSSDPYVSSLSGKSIPHRYPCEISVTNTRKATSGRLLKRDNPHATFLVHDSIPSKTKIDLLTEIISMLKFQRFKWPLTWYKVKLLILT